MNLRFIISFLFIFTIVATICICVARPTMHKSVLVYDSGYTIVKEDVTTVEEVDIPIMSQVQQPTTEKITVNEKIDNQIEQEREQVSYYDLTKQASPKSVATVETRKNTPVTVTQQQVSQKQQTQTPVKTSSTGVVKTTSQIPDNVKVTPTPVQSTTTTTPVTTPVQTSSNTQKAPVGQTVSQNVQHAPVGNTTVAVVQPKVIPQATQAPQPKVLTAQEEEIAWNKWRSNLQNQIMKDSKLPNMPLGTVFKFSFTVDKYGKVTNVKTWSTDSRYTPYAIQYIAPAIRSYQGHSILNFPAGSNRVITDVTGGWKISKTATFSSPSDFNDIEKVTR